MKLHQYGLEEKSGISSLFIFFPFFFFLINNNGKKKRESSTAAMGYIETSFQKKSIKFLYKKLVVMDTKFKSLTLMIP